MLDLKISHYGYEINQKIFLSLQFKFGNRANDNSSLIKALDDRAHILGHALHDLGRLDFGRHCVHFGRHAEVVEALALLPDGVLGVDPGHILVSLLQGLPHLHSNEEIIATLSHFIGC